VTRAEKIAALRVKSAARRAVERAAAGRAVRVGGKPPGAVPLACASRGLPTGDSRPCKTCTGTESVPLLACSRFGACTESKAVTDAAGRPVRTCAGCEARTDPPADAWRAVGLNTYFTSVEGAAYQSVLRSLHDTHAVEIGSHRGRTATLAATVLSGKRVQLHCVDPWPDAEIEAEFVRRMAPFGSAVVRHKGYSADAARKWDRSRRLGCVFIDGNHSYESVKQDLAAWVPLVSPGGVVCGHDYSRQHFPGVVKAVDERFGGRVQVRGSFWWVTLPRATPPRETPAPAVANPTHFAPALTRAERGKVYELVGRVDAALADVPHAICWGAALGYARFGELMPWDDDADFVAIDTPPVEELQRRLPDLRVIRHPQFIKVFDPRDPQIPGHPHSFPFVEINPGWVEGGEVVTHSGYGRSDDRFPLDALFPATRAKFGPVEVDVPRDPARVAVINFGDQCLTSALPPVWSHRHERRTGYPQTRVPLADLGGLKWVPPVYLINLNRRPDRLATATAKLDRAGVPFTRWPAVDGSKAAPRGYPGGAGAYGCLQSHTRLLAHCLDAGQGAVMVFEDDVTLCDNFLDRLADLFAALPPDWDAVFLGGQWMSQPTGVGHGVLRVRHPKGIHRTHAYVARGGYLRTLYHLWARSRGHCDQIWGRHQRHANVYAPTRWLCGQTAGTSDISGRRNAAHWWQPANAR